MYLYPIICIYFWLIYLTNQIAYIHTRYHCLLVVDTVASLGGADFFADRWMVDVVYTGSQKVLGGPPGVSPISFGPRAMAKIDGRKSPVKIYYFDIKLLGDYWDCFGKPRLYEIL